MTYRIETRYQNTGWESAGEEPFDFAGDAACRASELAAQPFAGMMRVVDSTGRVMVTYRAGGGLVRKWTDNTGKHTIEAEYRGTWARQVKLKKPDGSIATVPLERLSEPDQKWVLESGS